MARRGYQLVDGNIPAVYCDMADDSIVREGNTIHFSFNVVLKTPTLGAWDTYPWQVDLAVNGGNNWNNVQLKGNTGRNVIQNIEYYAHATSGRYSGSLNVGTFDSHIYVTAHFRRVGKHEAGTVGWHIPIPTTSGPHGLNNRVYDIESDTAKLSASVAGAGNYNSITKFQLEYGETRTYNKNLENHGPSWEQTFTIPDLQPGTIYYYRISAHSSLGYIASQEGWFQTEPSKDVRLIKTNGEVKIPKIVIIRPDGRIQQVRHIKVVK